MTEEIRQQAFTDLGSFLMRFTSEDFSFTALERKFAKKLSRSITRAMHHNGWFTKEDIYFALQQWGKNLSRGNIEEWMSPYQLTPDHPKTVAVIMAGNVPLVGFHDFLSVLLSGHKILVKQSSKDKYLLPCLADFLVAQNSSFSGLIEFTDEKLENYDAVIATGSNNTARYFAYYFSEKPHIIRKNRNAVAVLTGKEEQKKLKKIGEDIFRYHGLGCRNVSKIFVPENYDFNLFFEAIYHWNPIINHHKYANNYDYNKAVYLMSEFSMLENGFLILKEDKNYASPIACLFYEYYTDEAALQEKLKVDREQIQCIISEDHNFGTVNIGASQRPKLSDYADGVDTLAFLSKL